MRPTLTADTDFIFLKLLFQDVPRYAKFRQFVLGQDHDLERFRTGITNPPTISGNCQSELDD